MYLLHAAGTAIPCPALLRYVDHWHGCMLLDCVRVVCIPCMQLVQLSAALRALEPPSISTAINWSPNVYLTSNFLTTTAKYGATAKSEYLRPVSAALVWPHGDVLLLTDREADGVLAAVWAGYGGGGGGGGARTVRFPGAPHDPPPTLVWCGYATLSHTHTGPHILSVPLAGRAAVATAMAEPEAASVRLFSGAADYGGQGGALASTLRGMLRHPSAREACQAMVGVRGRVSHFERSDLERACE